MSFNKKWLLKKAALVKNDPFGALITLIFYLALILLPVVAVMIGIEASRKDAVSLDQTVERHGAARNAAQGDMSQLIIHHYINQRQMFP